MPKILTENTIIIKSYNLVSHVIQSIKDEEEARYETVLEKREFLWFYNKKRR